MNKAMKELKERARVYVSDLLEDLINKEIDYFLDEGEVNKEELGSAIDKIMKLFGCFNSK